MAMGSPRITFDKWKDLYSDRIEDMRSSAVRDLFAAASRSDIISLSGGMPDISILPLSEVAAMAAETINKEGVGALQYGTTDGRVQTKEALIEIMNEIGLRAKPDDMTLTAGAQQALDLLGKVFINPGDVVICEGPTYVGALQAFSAYQPDVHCIELDSQGIRTDILEEELKRLGKGVAKFIYVIPNFQNPSGVTLSIERRRRLLELSHEYEVPVIEDDPYGRLRFDGGHLKPLRALDDEVIYLGTVSKVFAPGLRTGWIVAPHPILQKINLAKQGTDLCGSALNQVLVEHYFRDIAWHKILQNLVKTYKVRRDAMLAALEEYFPPEVTWTHPEGGFFVWVTLPPYVDCDQMLGVALEHGVTFVPGTGFYPLGMGGKNKMRIAFCYEEPEKLREAIARLADVINERLELYRVFIAAGALDQSEEEN